MKLWTVIGAVTGAFAVDLTYADGWIGKLIYISLIGMIAILCYILGYVVGNRDERVNGVHT